MKNNNPIYIFTGPVTALVIILLLAGNVYCYLRWQHQKTEYNQALAESSGFPLLGDPPAFYTDDRAVFDFTGDTVMVLAPAESINLKPAWNILYKDKYGIYQTEDLPEEALNKVEQDTAELATP